MVTSSMCSAAVPEEDAWLQGRRTYRQAVTDFIRRYAIRSRGDFQRVDPRAVVFTRRRRGRSKSTSRRPTPGLTSRFIDRILRKYARATLGKTRGYSAHSMRATFITTALEKGAKEDVQEAVGHADPSTTKQYDRRGFNPERAAPFFANC